MGQGKSKNVYAFQPLPWPEAFGALKTIDQICGIASAYATQHLEQHALPVLNKVGELQRLPHKWELFDSDFDSLRGNHLIKLAAELHTALDTLEGCKYDMGMLAQKSLVFKSHRKAAEKALAILSEVEATHNAFFYQFELALYGSIREHGGGTSTRRSHPGGASLRGAPLGPGSLPRTPHTTGGGASSAAGAAAARSPPPAAATAARTRALPVAPSSGEGQPAGTSSAARAGSPGPEPPAPPQQQQQQARSPPAAQPASSPSPPAPAPPPADPNQQYVVVYLPQGPKGGGPRAILVPASALQPAPATPSPSTGGASPYASGGGSPYAAPAPLYRSPTSPLRQPILPPPPLPAASAAAAGYGSGAYGTSGGGALSGASYRSSRSALRDAYSPSSPYHTTTSVPYKYHTPPPAPVSYAPGPAYAPGGYSPLPSGTSPWLPAAAASPYPPSSPTHLGVDLSTYFTRNTASPPGSPRPAEPLSPGTGVVLCQPFTAHTTPTGEIVLQPQPGQPSPVLMQVADPNNLAAAAAAAVTPAVAAAASKAARDATGSTGGMHSTYTYVPSTTQPRVGPGGGGGGNSTYLTPYGAGGASGGGGEEYDEDVWYDNTSRSNGGADPGGASSRRNVSGGGASELMQRFRSMAAEADALADMLGGQQQQQGGARSPGAVEQPGGAAAVGGSRGLGSTQRAAEAPAPIPGVGLGPLSYERLAVLAGLDGGGGGGPWDGKAAAADAGGGGGGSGTMPAALVGAGVFALPDEGRLKRAEELVAVAEGGDWGAVVELAGSIRRGWWGDPRDAAVARGLLMQAALHGGSLDAQAALGEMAEQGEGLPGGRPDLDSAARHYAAAAAGGHRDATTAYAYLLERGMGAARDEARAAQLYASAAQRGCPTAANNLAKMILDGRGGIVSAAAAAGRGAASPGARAAGLDAAGLGVWAAPGGQQGGEAAPATLAMALFRRAAKGGSAAAWFNLGMCHLHQLRRAGGAGAGAYAALGGGAANGHTVLTVGPAGGRRGDGGGRAAGPAVVEAEAAGGPAEVLPDEEEALKAFQEAAALGHARAALRAGYMHLARSRAAAAVEAFATAAINGAVPPSASAASTGGAAAAASGMPTSWVASPDVEAEALWCLAQLAERQAAVLEGRSAAVFGAAAGGGTDAAAARAALQSGSRDTSGRRRMYGGSGDGGRDSVTRRSGDQGSEDGGGGGGGSKRGSGDGGDDEARAVKRLLATLAGQGLDAGPWGAFGSTRAAALLPGGDVAADDPQAAAAVAFANQLSRLDFACCTRPVALPLGALTGGRGGGANGGGGAADAERLQVPGLKRLRRQARELSRAAAGGGGDASPRTAGVGRAESRESSVNGEAFAAGGGGGANAGVAAALAGLDLQLQQPGERAKQARRAAADLMAAAGLRGHPGAMYWLAGWQWALGSHAHAVALWEAAGNAGHAAALMTLGSLAEGGQLPAGRDGKAAGGGGGGGGPDLAAAARYYLRAQECGSEEAVPAMRRVQGLLQRHVALQGRLEAVAALGAAGAGPAPLRR